MADPFRHQRDADRKTSGTLRRFLRWLRGPMHPLAADDARDRVSLIVCRSCRAALANPVDWHAVDESRWWIRLRCGECMSSREVVVSDEAAARLERDLEPGLREIAAAVTELEHDLICADDFGRWKR